MNHPRAAEIKSNTSNLSKSEKLVGVESIESKPTATSLDFLARSLSSPVVLNNLANNWHSLKWKKKKNQEKPTTASDAVAYLQWQLPKKITIGCGMKLWLTNSAIAMEILFGARLPFRDFPAHNVRHRQVPLFRTDVCVYVYCKSCLRPGSPDFFHSAYFCIAFFLILFLV